jgi:hypothetical protein
MSGTSGNALVKMIIGILLIAIFFGAIYWINETYLKDMTANNVYEANSTEEIKEENETNEVDQNALIGEIENLLLSANAVNEVNDANEIQSENVVENKVTENATMEVVTQDIPVDKAEELNIEGYYQFFEFGFADDNNDPDEEIHIFKKDNKYYMNYLIKGVNGIENIELTNVSKAGANFSKKGVDSNTLVGYIRFTSEGLKLKITKTNNDYLEVGSTLFETKTDIGKLTD